VSSIKSKPSGGCLPFNLLLKDISYFMLFYLLNRAVCLLSRCCIQFYSFVKNNKKEKSADY